MNIKRFALKQSLALRNLIILESNLYFNLFFDKDFCIDS